MSSLSAAPGRCVSVVLDENDAPDAVHLPGGRGMVRVARILDRWHDGEPSENWLVATGSAADTEKAESGIYILQHSARAEWRLYGWPDQAA